MSIALLLAAVLAAATPECSAQVSEARAAIDHANDDWLRAMNAGDAAAIAAAYADDGLFLLPDGEVLKGRAAVEGFYAARNTAGTPIEGGITSLGVACGEDGLLYEWGWGEVRVQGSEVRRTAPYLTVWRKVGGQWKIVRNLAF
ncbi:SgcJ/EcaC family oxidoreductase [Phenylobacterium sp. VNQ135]|uniref:SgcJ/EcaC family oxidoreductase n=1 Tax=Phenylobacterium sp. VNQ135 TaxID=3400922 RepID=UPI003C05C51E